MKPTFIALLALCLCLPVTGAENPPTPKEIAEVKASAEKGDGEASGLLARYYYNGLGLKKDMAEALKWARAAAQKGDSNGQNILGILYTTGEGVKQDFKEAVKWKRKAADQGLAKAQYNLAGHYGRGLGVEQDHAEAAKWRRKAAEQGFAPAQASLGGMYYYGQGVEKDFKEAMKWWRKAAEQGNAYGQNALGVMYKTGQGVEKDLKEAMKWYRKAAEQGHARAQNSLAYAYETGRGVPEDTEEAVKWYRKAALQGRATAQSRLGYMYSTGKGVEKDFKEAVKWYRKAAEQEWAYAQTSLAQMYRDGKGVKQDYKKAFEWFTKAAEQGYPIADRGLGHLYLVGWGVPKDNEKAYAWFTISVANGLADAKKSMSSVAKRMTPNQITKAEKLAKEMVKKNPKLIALAQDKPKPRINSTTTTIGVPHLAGISILRNKLRAVLRINPLGGGPAEYNFIEVGEMVHGVEVLKIDPEEGVVEVKVMNKTHSLDLDKITLASFKSAVRPSGTSYRPGSISSRKKPQLPKALPEKPLPPPKPEVRLVGMIMRRDNIRAGLRINPPRGGVAVYNFLEVGEMANGVEVLSIDPENGAVKLKIKGKIVSDVVQHWPAGPKANPPKKGSVTLSFSKAPIDMVLDVFSDLSGRTIIAHPNIGHPSLPRVFFELKPKGPMSEIGALEAIQAQLAAKGIGIEPLGNKFVRVLPLAQLDAKRVPKNAGAFRVVNEPQLEEGKIVIPAGHTMQGIPLDVMLDEFSDLTGRTIIAAQNLPRVTFDFILKNDLSFNEAVEFYQALLDIRGIGIEPLGNKFVRVLPLAQLDAKRVPKNAGAFRVVNEPQLEEGKIVIPAGHTMQGIPLDVMLEELGILSGRTIIAPVKLPRVTFDFRLKSDLSFNEAMEFYQALLDVRGIGVVLQGDKSALVLPASSLRHATYYHGVAYRDGEGVEKDEKEAVKWFRKAAEQGHAFSQACLAQMYRDGKGVEQDEKEAVKWFRKAAEQGHAEAQFTLGAMYYYAKGMPKDNVTTYAWYTLAAANGNETAKKLKGIIAKEMTPDQIAEAETLVKEMVKKNSKLKAVPKDFKSLMAFAEKGDARAQYALGARYWNGEGTDKDMAKCLAWWILAAKQGHQLATEWKPKAEKKMTAEDISKAQELSKEMVKKNPKLLNK